MNIPLPPEMVNQLVLTVATLLLTALTGLASLAIHKVDIYFKSKMGAENYDFMKSLAATVVRALEQSPAYKDFDGAKKKEAAIMQLVQLANRYGIPLAADTIERIVEEEVQRMNSELKDIPFEPLPLQAAVRP